MVLMDRMECTSLITLDDAYTSDFRRATPHQNRMSNQSLREKESLRQKERRVRDMACLAQIWHVLHFLLGIAVEDGKTSRCLVEDGKTSRWCTRCQDIAPQRHRAANTSHLTDMVAQAHAIAKTWCMESQNTRLDTLHHVCARKNRDFLHTKRGWQEDPVLFWHPAFESGCQKK